jgi:SNF2 family DNA or RNA helicase
MLIVHANWSQGALHLWAEDPARLRDAATPGAGDAAHPFAARTPALAELLQQLAPGCPSVDAALDLVLPSLSDAPAPSPEAAHALGQSVALETDAPPVPGRFQVPCITLAPLDAVRALAALEDIGAESDVLGSNGSAPPALKVDPSVTYFAIVARFVRHLVSHQRWVPSLVQDPGGDLLGILQPWLADKPTLERLAILLAAMPPSARAVADSANHEGWAILDDMLLRVTDALCREVFRRETLTDAISSRDPAKDLHVLWLSGLISGGDEIRASLSQRQDLIKGVRSWIGSLEDRGAGTAWRLMLKLAEPIDVASLRDFESPTDSVRWTLSFHLQSLSRPSLVVDAEDVWLVSGSGITMEGERLEAPQEVLLAELGRAARIYKTLEKSLESREPISLELSTTEAYKFLREFAPVLEEQGFGVQVPEWWFSPTVRLGARLKVDSEPLPNLDAIIAPDASGATGRTTTQLGLNTLVSYQWQIAVGQTSLTLDQFERLAAQHSPLIRLDGRWVEIRPEDVRAAMEFIRKNPGGQMEVGKALRLAYGSDARQTGIQILGMDATGWVATVFADPATSEKLPMLRPPDAFVGTLRPYQLKGLSWLAFLDRLGLGACLADDMGLGKTVQLLALLAHERQVNPGVQLAPTLLIVPMSVVANWIHEARRFTPQLKVLVHHGLERLQGQTLLDQAAVSDVVVTTYALAHRDQPTLSLIQWRRVVLDEAQNIKNPAAKQTLAVRSLHAPRRIALTGTPVENRLGELWSIMEFLNQGYLDHAPDFRRRFSIPIERYRDKHRAAQLRGLVQPFILRRLKTDPTVIADLPEKVESREFCYLTPEQATLYQTCVADMLSMADQTEGIQRRGVVLAGLIKLKQICNHPSHFLKEFHADAAPPNAVRSGKAYRIVEMLREVVDAGDQALVFTQFRQMGNILAAMLRHDLDRDILFLHGGTTAKQREEMVNAFQKGDGKYPIFILSLKAGGLGLNLTAATHVFHFDRWWNPAVESQATDRAFRIGQTRTVHVHKFVVSGTLEERIDQMIEAKTELAQNVIGSGEEWLTELSTSQLRDILALRMEAVGDER